MNNKATNNVIPMGQNLSTKEAADILKCVVSTITKFCRLGKIRAFRVGTDWRIPESSLSQFIQEQMRGN